MSGWTHIKLSEPLYVPAWFISAAREQFEPEAFARLEASIEAGTIIVQHPWWAGEKRQEPEVVLARLSHQGEVILR